MDNPVLLVTNEGRIEFANPALCKAFSLKESPDELVGQSALEVVKTSEVRPDDALPRIQEIVRQSEPVKGEEVVLPDGRTFLRDFVPLDVGGEPRGRLWLHFEITERKRAEEALREEDRRKAEFLAVLSRTTQPARPNPQQHLPAGTERAWVQTGNACRGGHSPPDRSRHTARR
jgi:PAS domain S-box-containing protein